MTTLDQILATQSIDEAQILLRESSSVQLRLSHLMTLLTQMQGAPPDSISSDFLTFVLNDLVDYSLQEETYPLQRLTVSLSLCDVFNGKTSLPIKTPSLPEHFLSLLESVLSTPILHEQLATLRKHLKLFWLTGKLLGSQYKEFVLTILEQLDISSFTIEDILLTLREVAHLQMSFGESKPVPPCFFEQINAYLRANTLEKKDITAILNASIALKPRKLIKPAYPPSTQDIIDPNLWPEKPYFSNGDTEYNHWVTIVSNAFKLANQHIDNPEIKQQALNDVKTASGNRHRELVISYLFHGKTNTVFLEQILFLSTCSDNFLLNEPDSSAALCFAMQRNSLPLLKFFIESLGVNIINPPNKAGHPLFEIIRLNDSHSKYTEISDYFIKKYRDVANETYLTTTIRYQDQPLFDRFFQAELIRLKHSAYYLNCFIDENGLTPLMHALKTQGPNADYFIATLISHTKPSELFFEDKEQRNAFAYALQYGHIKYFFQFLDCVQKEHPECTIEGIFLPNDDTPMFYALKHAQKEMVAALITQYRSLISNDDRTDEGDTLLLYAAKQGYFWAVEMFLHAGADIHATNDHGMTVGHYLVLHNQFVLLELYLYQYNLNIMAKNNNSESLIDLAAKSFHNEQSFRICIQYLREKKRPFDLRHQAYFGALLEFIASLPDEGIAFRDEHGQSLLHLACLYGKENATILNRLIHTHHFPTNIVNVFSQTPLYVLVHQQMTEQVIAFINTYSPRLTDLDAKKSTLLHLICETNNLTLAEHYIRKLRLQTLKTRNQDGKTPLDLAFNTGNETLISLLWDHMDPEQQHLAVERFKSSLQADRIQFALQKGYVDRSSSEEERRNMNDQHALTLIIESPAVTIPIENNTHTPKEPIVYPSIEEVIDIISVQHNKPKLRVIKQLLRQYDGEENAFFNNMAPHATTLLECALKTKNYGVINQVLRFPCVNKGMEVEAQKARDFLELALSSHRGSIVRLALRLNALSCIAHERDNQALFDAVVNDNPSVVDALFQLESVRQSIITADNRIFIAVCRVGNLETIDLFLSHPKIVQHLHETQALMIAIETNHLDFAYKLLAFPHVRASVNMAYLLETIKQKHIDLFMVLLSLEHIQSDILSELATGQCSLLNATLENRCDDMASMLLQIPEVERYARLNHILPSHLELEPYLIEPQLNPYWIMPTLILVPVWHAYPVINPLNLDDVYDASMNGQLEDLKQYLDGFEFPPYFVQELYQILYLAVCYHQAHVVDYLLQNTVLAQYTLERVNQLTIRAIVKNDAMMLITLMKHDVIRNHLSSACNYPLRCAARYDAVPMAKILLDDPTVHNNAAAMNNRALRTAAERGSLDMVKLLYSVDSVRRQITVFQNAPFRKAYNNGHTAVCLYLLNDANVLQKLLGRIQYPEMIQSFIKQRLKPFPDDSAIKIHRRLYLLIAYCYLKDHDKQLSKDIMTLLQHPLIKTRLHLGVSSIEIKNELLSLALKNGHEEIANYLKSLPQVQKIEEAASASSISQNYPKRLFSPPKTETPTHSTLAAFSSPR